MIRVGSKVLHKDPNTEKRLMEVIAIKNGIAVCKFENYEEGLKSYPINDLKIN